MKRLLLCIGLWLLGCSSFPNSPDHVCGVYMSCVNAQKWDLAERYVYDGSTSLLQLSPLLTKNYNFKSLSVTHVEYGRDSLRARVHSQLTYKDGTALDMVFLLEKDSTQLWKIKSI